MLWKSLTKDRRFAGQFKRQTPVGRQIPDFVSFVYRVAVELIGANETDDVAKDRSERRAWLEARDYRVVDVREADVMAAGGFCGRGKRLAGACEMQPV